MSAVLEIKGLDLSVGTRSGAGKRVNVPILRGVSLELEPGEVHGLVGESGAGKTMVGKSVLGIQPSSAAITAGEIRFDGREITHLGDRERRHLLGLGMAMIPQDPMTSLNPARRIGSQIGDGLRLHLGLDREAARTRALELMHDVHIRLPERVLEQYPHELSGGMRQRILIAIAFACRPKLIIADEPTTALDVTVQRQVLRLIKNLQESVGTAILFIAHDLGVVAKICDRVSVIHAGRIVESAPAAELFARPAHAYTRALMADTPRYDRPSEVLAPVPAALNEALLAEAESYDSRDSGDSGGRGEGRGA